MLKDFLFESWPEKLRSSNNLYIPYSRLSTDMGIEADTNEVGLIH